MVDSSGDPIVAVEAVSKRFGEGASAVWALRGVSLSLHRGEFVSVMGPSGSGKSTLLSLIAALDDPTRGRVVVAGKAVDALPEGELARMRRRTLTIIFQFFNLLPTLTAAQNVAVPLRADRRPAPEVRRRVAGALDAVGLTKRAHHYPAQLSGGEMQRVAIARAFATDAAVILADEPTGNLDTIRGEEILGLLKRAAEREGRSVLLVTHDARAAAHGDRLITLRDGLIEDQVETPSTGKVLPLSPRSRV
jgi:putative ABC transport system ATP-binding protein